MKHLKTYEKMSKEIDGNKYVPTTRHIRKEIDGNRASLYVDNEEQIEIDGNRHIPPKGDGDKEYGVVRFYNHAKGYGFIQTEKERDYFTNNRLIIDEINVGDEVEFIIKVVGKNLKATKVKKRRL